MKPLELRDERGMMVVLFAVILPLLLIMAALVWDTGNWWTHRKHLQTKADAAAFAGGGVWEFPCGTSVDARIVAEARKYAGPHMGPGNQDFRTTAFNPQIGGTPGEDIHVVLNGDNWWDDDAGLDPADSTSPLGSVCESKTLDVKATEENNNPLFGLLPFFPDLKRKARVEIREAEGITGLLPIAVRAPEPVSAAVFYNEQTGDIYKVKYFVKNNSILGLPGGLQGWSTYNTEDSSTWARFTPGAKVGVAIAISLRGACNTNLPGGPPGPAQTKIATSATPCFEDEVSPNTVSELCNQGGSTQIVNCHFATGNWPSEVVQSGLHFIRGYPTGNAGEGRPELRSAWLENVDCPSNAYFSSVPGTSPCNVKLTVKVDIGSLMANPPPNPPNTIVETRTASNTQVRYCLVRPSSANNECRNQFDPAQDLQCTGAGPEISCSTVPGTHLPVTRNSLMNAVAIEVKLQGTTVVGRPGCTLAVAGGGGGRGGGGGGGGGGGSFSDNCRWFYDGDGFFSEDTEPTRDDVIAAPVQRAFRGNSVNSASVRWLRLSTDTGCSSGVGLPDNEAASQPSNRDSCFFMDMGLKGGLAVDADEPAVVFDDGTGTSQTGTVDCDPTIPQGQVLIDGIVNGCRPWYARHPFDWNPACPPANSIFDQPNPGSPWDDGRWPPLRCIKTRPTGTPNQFARGLDTRIFGSNNAPCPADAAGFVRGRNYWDQDNNPLNLREYGYKDDSPARDTHFNPNDPRIVTIFLTTSNAFTGSGQNTYPITGFVQVYITGYGSSNGPGNLTIDDPCAGNTAPPAEDYDCNPPDCGYIVWGHFINYSVPGPRATPSGVLCNPGSSTQPCVPTLVE